MVPRRSLRVKQAAEEEEELVKAIKKALCYIGHVVIKDTSWKATRWPRVCLDVPKHIRQL